MDQFPIPDNGEDNEPAADAATIRANASVAAMASDYRWVILGVAFAVQFSFSLALSVMAPLGPFIKPDLNLSMAEFGLLGTAFYLGTALVLVFTGWLVDETGVRYVMLLGQVGVGILLAAGALTQASWQLLFVLFIGGFAMSASGPTGAKAVVTWFSATSRATAMGIKQSAVPIAGVVTGALLPAAGLAFGWRVSLAMVGAAIAVIGVITFVLYREAEGGPHRPRASFRHSWASIKVTIADRDILALSVGAALFMGVQFAISNYLVLNLRDVFAGSVVLADPIVIAGLYFSITQIGGGVGRIGWGILSDRRFHGRRKGILLFIISLGIPLSLAMGFFSHQLDPLALAILVFAIGVCTIGWSGLHLSMISELSGLQKAGTGIGLSLTFCYIGMMGGAPLFGFLVDLSNSYTPAWVAMAALLLIGVGFVAIAHEKNH